MPRIVHACGAKLTFAPEMVGRTGKCPTCGEPVTVPAMEPVPAPRGGLAPRPIQPRSDLEKVELDPPPHWDAYQAFIDGKGPNPRPTIIPANLMLREEADAKWEAAKNKAPQSKFSCPGCKTRLEVGAVVCTKCGLDLKTGKTLDGKSQINDTGVEYLAQIPWLKDGPEEFSPGGDDGDDAGDKPKPRFPQAEKAQASLVAMADREGESALTRASERLKTAARSALTKENATHALANKLVAAGLAITCLAGGVNYFDHDDEIHKALAGFARDAGQNQVAAAVEDVDVKVDDWKHQAFEKLPAPVRNHLATAALAGGILALGFGLRLKIQAHFPTRGKVLQDVGRAISGPGFVGILVFAALSWRGAHVLRHAIGSFVRRVFSGEMSAADLGELTTHYAPWAYDVVGGVLWLGLTLGVVAVIARLGETRVPPGARIVIEVARHTVTWAAALALAYFLSATIVAIASYGGALNVIVWPWKVDKGAFLVALGFMGFGIGLARTGTAELAREKAALAPITKATS